MRLSYDELVDVEIMIILGIGDSRFERLLYGRGNAPALEREFR